MVHCRLTDETASMAEHLVKLPTYQLVWWFRNCTSFALIS